MIKSHFEQEFDGIVSLINSNKNIVFVRYGDGELMLINGVSVPKETQAYNVDKWFSEGNTLLGDDLKKTLEHTEDNWYYGIPCQCCNNECKKNYLDILKVPNNQITYANLWVNSNYKHFKNWVGSIKKEVVLITNHIGKNNNYPFNVIKYISVPDDCVNFYENNKNDYLENLKEETKNFNDKLFFISAGPLSEIIIDFLFNLNPNNTYIDVGSSLDEYTHKQITRPYMVEGTEYNKKICNL